MNSTRNLFRGRENGITPEEIHSTDSTRNFLLSADEILVDGQGFTIRHGSSTVTFTHSQLEYAISEDEVMTRLFENEKRQVGNPDHLPYDHREGF